MKILKRQRFRIKYIVESFLWGEDFFEIKEYSYGVEVFTRDLNLSNEHTTYKWISFEEASSYLKWDSNKTALWELNQRLKRIY